jgi:hypothetical protein
MHLVVVLIVDLVFVVFVRHHGTPAAATMDDGLWMMNNRNVSLLYDFVGVEENE